MALNAEGVRDYAQRILNLAIDMTTLALDDMMAIKAAVPGLHFSVLNKNAILNRIDNEILRRRI